MWEDIKERAKEQPRGPWGTIAQKDIERLLADAEALLRYMKAAEAYILIAEYGGGVSRDLGAVYVQAIAQEYSDACDALPAYLREQGEG